MDDIKSSNIEPYNQDNYPRVDVHSIREKYGIKFSELMDIINKHDPIELLRVGAPENEYDLEVATIIPLLDGAHNEAEVLLLITNEFERWFGPGQNDYLELSKDIYKWMQKSNPQLT
jgi:hypothetical protein